MAAGVTPNQLESEPHEDVGGRQGRQDEGLDGQVLLPLRQPPEDLTTPKHRRNDCEVADVEHVRAEDVAGCEARVVDADGGDVGDQLRQRRRAGDEEGADPKMPQTRS